MVDKLKLQFHDNRGLNNLMDAQLPPRPAFKRRTYLLGGERLEMYTRDPIEVLKELYGRPDFARHLVFAPEKHFIVEGDEEERAYSDMHTGTWWWWMQARLLHKSARIVLTAMIRRSLSSSGRAPRSSPSSSPPTRRN